MENVLISIFLFELFFTMLLVINCAVDELLPIGEYKTWLQNRNWFGKIYIYLLQLYLLFLQQLLYISLFSLCS